MNDGGDNYGGLLGMMNDGGGNTPGMGGLLGGFFDDPRKMAQLAAFGQALAAASARPKNRGVALAQGMSGMINGGLEFDQREMQKQMQDLQMKKAMEELRKSKTVNDMISQGLGGNPQGQGMPQGQSVPPMAEMGGMPKQGQAAPDNAGILKMLPFLALAEGKPTDAHSMFIKNAEGIKQDAGAYYTNPLTGERKYNTDPTKGFAFDPNTQTVSPLAGYNTTNAAMKGAETGATEAAKAPYNFVDVPQSDGTTRKMRSDLASSALSGQPPAPPGIPQQVWDTYKSGKDFTAQVGPDGRTNVQTGSQLGVSANPLKMNASEKLNGDFVTRILPEVSAKGQSASDMLNNVQASRMALSNLGKTGWGTETKAAAANVLVGLGIAPKNAEMYASNAQVFQSQSMTRLWDTLNAAKGPQTEGDAARASKTFAQLSNTPQANKFILDLAEATAKRDRLKAEFYREALPVAQEKGDLQMIEREWAKRAPSIWTLGDMPSWTK